MKNKQDKVTEITEIMPDSEIFCPDTDAQIAELAYYRAESRGFEPGRELEDWLEAEQEYLLLN
jgi:hypothetical protein